jgi:phospholipase A1
MRPHLRPCTRLPHFPLRCCTATVTAQPPTLDNKTVKNLERLLDPIDTTTATSPYRFMPVPVKLGDKWREYQGISNWEGLLDPLDDNLRSEILRYGKFVEATYNSFDFDPSSPSYANSLFTRSSFFERAGIPDTGYRLKKYLRATSGIQLPRWIEKAPSWVATQSSWIGYVAVCQDKDEIARLGRRDVVIAYRGTATCLEWLENLRATLTHLPSNSSVGCGPMVESGFLSLYTSGTAGSPSLQDMVRGEISRILQSYGDEPLSLTITGHSLGAALATLTAYDIKTTFKRAPLVTVISFGGPRVGNRSFRLQVEKQGTKVLRIVNSDDLITKVPGFVIDDDQDDVSSNKRENVNVAAGLPSWIQKRVEDTQWVYAEVGRELRLSSKDSPYVNGFNVATCHDLKTYLHLVDGFISSTCPFRASAKMVLDNCRRKKKPSSRKTTPKT